MSGYHHDRKSPKDKDPLHHVIEAQANGFISTSEIHGREISGCLSAMSDAARETAIVLPIVWLLLSHHISSTSEIFSLLSIFCCGWLLWKMGKGAWLGWFRLEKLHRMLEQERWEIEHHYQQEREELAVLYAAKGFEGKLLEEVLDVLMADNDRLLKIMIEEELGLSLEAMEHPLKQGFGAALGVFLTAFLCLSLTFIWPKFGIFLSSILTIAFASTLSAYLAQNDIISGIIWNLGLAILAISTVFFLLEWHQLNFNS